MQDLKDGFTNFVAVALVIVVKDFLFLEMITQLIHPKKQILQVNLYHIYFDLDQIKNVTKNAKIPLKNNKKKP